MGLIPHHRSGCEIGFGNISERRSGQRVVRGLVRRLANGDERPVDGDPCNDAKIHQAAVDHRQAGPDALVLDRFNVVAADAGAWRLEKCRAPAPDTKVTTLSGKCQGDVPAVVMAHRIIIVIHRRAPRRAAGIGSGLKTRHDANGRPLTRAAVTL